MLAQQVNRMAPGVKPIRSIGETIHTQDGDSMNRTQQLTWKAIDLALAGDALLLEALLRRGFLAYYDTDGVWLGTGSHVADIAVLQLIGGLIVEPVQGHPDRACLVAFAPVEESAQRNVALRIVGLPEHHVGDDIGSFTSTGPAPFLPRSWTRYCDMLWGAKLPVCPACSLLEPKVDTALDTGVALLVKALPLARIATSLSCDGHGTRGAHVSFHFPWDAAWFGAVFDWLPFKPGNSCWCIRDEALMISTKGRYDDESVAGMLNDIQTWSRQLLDREVIQFVGTARENVIQRFKRWRYGISDDLFYQEACHQFGAIHQVHEGQ